MTTFEEIVLKSLSADNAIVRTYINGESKRVIVVEREIFDDLHRRVVAVDFSLGGRKQINIERPYILEREAPAKHFLDDLWEKNYKA